MDSKWTGKINQLVEDMEGRVNVISEVPFVFPLLQLLM